MGRRTEGMNELTERNCFSLRSAIFCLLSSFPLSKDKERREPAAAR